MIGEPLAGMRRVAGTGVLMRVAPIVPAVLDARPAVAAAGDRAGRLARAQATLDRLAAGWAPLEDDLADAPILDAWSLVTYPNGVSLLGRVEGHPLIGSSARALTSTLIALDGRHLSWGRTVARFYRLGRPEGAGRSS